MPVAVEVTDEVRQRLVHLVDRRPTMTLMDGSGDDPAQVVVLSVTDASGIARIRELQRSARPPRVVVVADGVTWFEAAFEAGADAFIDLTADDGTVEAAIVGRWR